MTITSYRIYCQTDNCHKSTVIQNPSQNPKSTDWQITSLTEHTGRCPTHNPTKTIEENRGPSGQNATLTDFAAAGGAD